MQYTITGGTDFADVLNQDGHSIGHSDQTPNGWTAVWVSPYGRKRFFRSAVSGALAYKPTREQAIAWITAQEDNYRG